MRSILSLSLVLMLLLCGCSSAGSREIAAAAKIAEGDRLAAAGGYDAAVTAYIDASKIVPSGDAHETALRKASLTVEKQVANEPLTAQVAAMKTLLAKSPDGILPLTAHNWLCLRLIAAAKDTVAVAKVSPVVRAAQALAAETTASSPATGSMRTVALTRTRSKGATSSVSAARSKTATRSPAASKATSRTVAAQPLAKKREAARSKAASGSLAAITIELPSPPGAPSPLLGALPTGDGAVLLPPADLREIAAELPGLGQPVPMQQLYVALAELSSALEAASTPAAAYSQDSRLSNALLLANRRLKAAD
jgi:hypothetical protein